VQQAIDLILEAIYESPVGASFLEKSHGFRRYTNDFLIGIWGRKDGAVSLKSEIFTFLPDSLKLELSEKKTPITHAQTGRAKFLGVELTWG
jgi:hypothetical protein